jgi:hypothetical protein
MKKPGREAPGGFGSQYEAGYGMNGQIYFILETRRLDIIDGTVLGRTVKL